METNVDQVTGEVKSFYPGPYSKMKKSSQDLSNVFEDVFEEIPPYSVDIKTGDLINKTSLPIIKKVGKVNVQEKIQSFVDDVDIYKILERVAISGDTNLFNRRIGTFGDFVNLPDNLNDFNDYVRKSFSNSSNLPDELIKAALNNSIKSGELESLISKHVEKAIESSKKSNEVVKKGEGEK